MSISFECANCGKAFTVGDEVAGKTGRCKQCGATMQIPMAGEDAAPSDVFDLDEPVLPPARVAPEPTATRRDRPAGKATSDIAQIAARLRAGGPPQPRKPEGSAWKRIGAGVGVVLCILAVAGRVAKMARIGKRLNQPAAAAPASPEQARQQLGAKLAQFASGPIALPRFPDLGPGREVRPGVMFHEVILGPTPMPLDAPPGQGGKIWVYLPAGDHSDHSLPCVLISGAGTNLLNGMELGEGDQAEHWPYVAAGFAVVAFEIDGMLQEADKESDQKVAEAMFRFQKARAGLVNAHIALEYALARVPAIDPGRINVAGHSSAGSLAVLFAETEPRLKSAVAFAPALDYGRNFNPQITQLITNAGFGALLTRYAPLSGVEQLQCPLFLFNARDDETVPITDSEGFITQAQVAGKAITFDVVDSGGHYQPMIDEGIPHAIAWLGGKPLQAEPEPQPEPTPAPEPAAQTPAPPPRDGRTGQPVIQRPRPDRGTQKAARRAAEKGSRSRPEINLRGRPRSTFRRVGAGPRPRWRRWSA